MAAVIQLKCENWSGSFALAQQEVEVLRLHPIERGLAALSSSNAEYIEEPNLRKDLVFLGHRESERSKERGFRR